ncbi:MAG: Enoyl-CoA hydratase, partial [uncultured Solirubrobacteraceae bacterium]
ALRLPPLRGRRLGRRDHRARRARDAQRPLRRRPRRPDRRVRAGPRRRRGPLRRAHLHAREGVLERRQPGRLRRGGPAHPQALRHPPLPAPVPAHRPARQADDLRRQRARARRGARARARVRPDRREGHRPLRDPRDQRRRLPVHDHGAHLPQRRAQEDERAAAARRPDLGGRGGGDRDRQQGGRARRVRRRGRGVGGQARRQVAGDDAPGQGGDVPPAGHGVRRGARVPACPALARVRDGRHPGGRQGVLREARPRLERPV